MSVQVADVNTVQVADGETVQIANAEAMGKVEADPSITGNDKNIIEFEGTQYTVGKSLFCNFSPSPYPVYVCNLLFFIPCAVNLICLDSVLFNKICYFQYKNQTQCADPDFSVLHPELQEQVTVWGNYHVLTYLPLCVIVNLMLSSYCDRIGHKLPYMLPCVGNAAATIYLALLASPQFINWPMASVLGYSVLYSIFGSYAMVLMSSFSYVGLASTKEKRTISMAITEGTFLAGAMIGSLINGPIIDNLGLANMMYINSALTVLPLPVVLICITDITVKSDRKYTWRDVIGLSHLMDSFNCAFQKRKGNSRLALNLCFVIYILGFSAISGILTLGFLYFVKEKELSLTLYSVFNTYGLAMKVFGGPFLVWLIEKYFKPDHLTLGLVAASGMSIAYLIIPIDAIPYSIWIGATFWGFQSVFFAITRSLQISFVNKDELGKLFGVDAILETVVGAIATIAFRSFYAATVTFSSGLYLDVCSALFILVMIVFLCLIKLKNTCA